MFDSLSVVNIVRMTTAFTMLGLASFLDLKKREINDMLWIAFSGVSILLVVFSPDILFSLKVVGMSLIIAPVALLLWRLGMFGGADALCLVVLASLAPMFTITTAQLTPFTILTNAAILSVASLFVNLSRNIISITRKENIFKDIDETRMKKILAIFIGYKAKNPKHSFSLETVIDGKKHLDFSLKHVEHMSFCNEKETWVTPGMPYILYIAAGFIIQVFYGDIIFNLLKLF